ncbi:carbohydrate ABC transporter permease [Rhizobium laguerreae]|uniref:Carbohydrate ABC transporter permease n=1 Tax=Rhizobium laguerreae TaxID=1076926 RepID=A0AB35FE95_9HYPH|nr:carbohydrate ABC transporter permease [Rhizobium laguerreae]MBY3064672.1 carbohydrate ABC transporter permease [Rhizobium laguerreae]MBY3307783.1 carbohydrate ABC transporter permease [Rhizobium laguerreae]
MTAISATSHSGRETKVRRRPLPRPSRVVIFVFLFMAAAFFAVPLYVIVVTSLKTMDQIREGQIFSLPSPLTVDAWSYAWTQACSGMNCNGVRTGFVNSLYILAPSLVLTISLSIVTGYGLALWNVKWANGFLFVLFICAFVPFQIIMYPLIKITGSLQIYGTTFGIAVIHSVLSLPFLTLIFRNYFKGMPPQIIAAAMIDSGSFWRIFFEIVLPMSGNIMIVVLILMITGIWNDFLVGLTFGAQDTQPMTVVLNNITVTTTGAKNYAVDMASALLTALPPLVIYFVLGRFFIQGITAGAIKG